MVILPLCARVSYTDIRFYKIGHWETLVLALAGLLYHQNITDSLLGAVIVSGLVELVNLKVSGLSGIGGGDIRLYFDTGLILGTDAGLWALLLSLILGLTGWGIHACNKSGKSGEHKGFEAGDKIPLGPGICIAVIMMMIIRRIS